MDIELSPMDALKMFEEQGQEQTPAAEPKTEVTAPAAEPKAEVVEQPQEQVEQREPEGVATKDGKHVIPYSVLQSERTRAAAAERELVEARAQLAAHLAAATDPKQAAKTGGADTPEVSQEDEDRLAALEEDFPSVAAELKATRELVKQLAAQIKPLKESTQQAEDRRANEAAMTVQEAIDTLPKMAHIQSANPEAYELAQQFDATLRNRADWAGKPLTERFAKVVELVEASLGEIAVPGQTPPLADKEALKKAAAAKLATAAKTVPTSLSQFPAGEPVAADEAAAVEQMSTPQLASKLGKMSPAQMDAYFASL
jgi:hypothetical protein